MKYSAIVAASAALALASPQAKVPKAAAECPSQCGPDEMIQTECRDQSRCMCDGGFFDAWTECRQCLYGPSFDTDPNYRLNVEGINSVSARICPATATESFQPVWSEIANRLGIFDAGVGAPAAAPAIATASAPAPAASGASAVDGAGPADAISDDGPAPAAGGSGGASSGAASSGGAGSSARSSAGVAAAAATSTRAGAGSASPTNGVSGARGGNSTSSVSANAGNSGKVVSGLAVAAVGAAAMLAL